MDYIERPLQGAFLHGLTTDKVIDRASELITHGAKLTEIPTANWDIVDAGQNRSGWDWYRVFQASENTETIYGIFGVNSKGSYMFMVKTSDYDFQVHQSDYAAWSESISFLSQESLQLSTQ